MWQVGEKGGSECAMRCPCVTNTKLGQDHFSVPGPLGGGTQSFNSGLNQGQFIASSPVGIPVDLPRFTDCSGNQRIEVLKGQNKVLRADEDLAT